MLKVIAALVLALLFVLPAGAQDEPQNALNFCAGELTYDIPQGWITYATERNADFVTAALTLSETSSKEEASIQFPYIVISVRATMDETFSDNTTSEDIVKILNGGAESLVERGYVVGEIRPHSIQNLPAAEMIFQNDTYINDLILINLGENLYSNVQLVISADDLSTWNEDLFTVAESIAFDALRFNRLENNPISLTKATASSDCVISFAYPSSLIEITEPYFVGTYGGARLATSKNEDLSPFDNIPTGEALIEIEVDLEISKEEAELATVTEELHDTIAETYGDEGIVRTKTDFDDYIMYTTELHVPGQIGQFLGAPLEVVLQYPNSTIVTISLYTPNDEVDQWRDIVLAIARSFHLNKPPAEDIAPPRMN